MPYTEDQDATIYAVDDMLRAAGLMEYSAAMAYNETLYENCRYLTNEIAIRKVEIARAEAELKRLSKLYKPG